MRRAKTRHGSYSEEMRQLMRIIRQLDATARRTLEET
jgi:hypothetical protein